MKSPLSNEELCASALRGDAGARNELIENNLGFIRKTANELWSSQRELNSDLLLDRVDLEQEGALGLLRCVETFDPESGGKFLSYAAPAVRKGRATLVVLDRSAGPNTRKMLKNACESHGARLLEAANVGRATGKDSRMAVAVLDAGMAARVAELFDQENG